MKRVLLLAAIAGLLAIVPARAANPVVVMDTSMGTIKIELYPEKAPVTVKNFLAYVDDKHYDGTIFHRVMSKENWERDFMIQGGGFTKEYKEKKVSRDPIKNESNNGLSNRRGTIAMARLTAPDSATAQFYINVGDNERLDGGEKPTGYTVFGKVVEGMDIVDRIKAVKTGTHKLMMRHPRDQDKIIEDDAENVPVEIVLIKTARVDKGK